MQDIINPTKMFEYSIDTNTPCKFLTNRDRNVFDYLSNTLNHTCFRGVLITRVIEVDTISMARVIHTNTLATCTLNIIFKAEIVHFVEGDIVDLVKIVIEDGHMYGKHDYVTISFIRNNSLKPLKKEQVIPIKLCDMQRYNVCNTTISSNGTLLVCDTGFDLYHIKGTLSETERDYLTKLITSLESMLINIDYSSNKIDGNIVEKISADPSIITQNTILYLLYSHIKYDIPNDVINIKALLDKHKEFDVVIFKDTRIPRETMLIQTKPRDEIKNVEPPLLSPYKGIYALLMPTFNILKNINNITEFYKKTTPMEYNNLFNVWMANKIS